MFEVSEFQAALLCLRMARKDPETWGREESPAIPPWPYII
jgi:hypothetical protein